MAFLERSMHALSSLLETALRPISIRSARSEGQSWTLLAEYFSSTDHSSKVCSTVAGRRHRFLPVAVSVLPQVRRHHRDRSVEVSGRNSQKTQRSRPESEVGDRSPLSPRETAGIFLTGSRLFCSVARLVAPRLSSMRPTCCLLVPEAALISAHRWAFRILCFVAGRVRWNHCSCDYSRLGSTGRSSPSVAGSTAAWACL